MFERFTKDARQVVTGAQEQARALKHSHIGTEHLLLSLLDGDDAASRATVEHGLNAPGLRERIARTSEDPLDPEALGTLGIDLDAVREATERNFGEGALDVPAARYRLPRAHIPFTPEAKKALELSLRHAIRLKQKEIRSGHLLLGVLHDDRFASVRLAAEEGVDVPGLRARIDRLMASAAA